MTAPPPSARAVQARLRRARRAHRSRSLGDLLTDVYLIVLLVAIYGWAVVEAAGDFLHHQVVREPADPGVRYWIAVGFALALAGLAYRGLAAIGPLQMSPALLSWVASAPLARRDLLLPRFAVLVAAVASGAGLLALAAAAVARSTAPAGYAWAALAGLSWGTIAASLGVAAQAAARPATATRDEAPPPVARTATAAREAAAVARGAGPPVVSTDATVEAATLLGAAAPGPDTAARPAAPPWSGRWRAWPVRALVVAGAAVALAVVVGSHLPVAFARPSAPVLPAVALAGTVLAAVGLTLGVRALPRVDRASLSSGARVASAVSSAILLLDPTMLAALVENRRWLAVGRVRSRPFGPGPRGWVLLRADLRRAVRHRAAVAWWAGLALVVYAVATAVPALAATVQVLGAYLVAERLAGGLRAVCRSAGLRRSLGGTDATLTAVHLALPAAAAALWWLATLPAAGTGPLWLPFVLVTGVVAAVYRSATRPPMVYGGAVAETPFGTIPVDLIRQVVRGPDLLALLVVIQLAVR